MMLVPGATRVSAAPRLDHMAITSFPNGGPEVAPTAMTPG